LGTTIYSSINAGMCNQFLVHYVSKLLCIERDYLYKCGIQFVAEGFPDLDNQCVPAAQNAIRLNRAAIREKGTLHSYPFQDDEVYVLDGMLGPLADDYFPGISKRATPRRFLFDNLMENITNYELRFTQQDLLNDFWPGSILTEKLRNTMAAFQDRFLVGIHRRRTDYATWREGLYMDSDEQILEKIKYFRSACGSRRPTFMLCTDEPETAKALAQEEDVVLVNAEKEVEWLVLQQTKFIIGAVSTFTFTAAGFKSIPYVFANEVITDDFQSYVQLGLARP
jgi:hypothetical protein